MNYKTFKTAIVLWTTLTIVSLQLYAYCSSEWFIKRSDIVAEMLKNAQYISNGGKLVFMGMDLFIIGYFFLVLLIVHFIYTIIEKKYKKALQLLNYIV